jgi:hypothetical protein
VAGEPTQDSEWRGEFDRIVNTSLRDRPQPVGPYMRWPLGAALGLMCAQVVASVLDALVAATLLTGGHNKEVTTGSLWLTLVVTTGVALVLGWAAYNVRLRLLPALYVAVVVEVIEVFGRTFSLVRSGGGPLGQYIGLTWAIAAVATLAMPSSRAYCTRRRTGAVVRARSD